MTNAEKIKFLRSEGWKAFGLGRSWHADPLKPRGHETEPAYRIAARRKCLIRPSLLPPSAIALVPSAVSS